jgi:hypothetical protein
MHKQLVRRCCTAQAVQQYYTSVAQCGPSQCQSVAHGLHVRRQTMWLSVIMHAYEVARVDSRIAFVGLAAIAHLAFGCVHEDGTGASRHTSGAMQ